MRSVFVDCSPFVRNLMTPEIAAIAPDLHVHVGDPDPARLAELLGGAVAVVNGHTRMDATLLVAHPMLRSIVFLGSGPASYIDLAAAERLGIRVRAVLNYGDRTVAEHGFALILAAARRVAAMDHDLRSGVWQPLDGIELAGKTLGVVGLGGIGREMVRIAHGFGMRVVAWSRGGVASDLPCLGMDLDELLRNANVVSLNLRLDEATRRIIDARRIGLLQPGAILVNTARGGLVDEDALVAALQARRIGHAALDVFATEPLPLGHPLTLLDNVTLTAHAGFKTPEATKRLIASGLRLLRQDLDSLAAGATLPRA